MSSNLDRYKADLDALAVTGDQLWLSMGLQVSPESFEPMLKKEGFSEALLKTLPSMKRDYQSWYSSSKAVLRQLLLDRVSASSDYMRSLPLAIRLHTKATLSKISSKA